RNRPSSSETVWCVTCVGTCRTVTAAPARTAPDWSITRPLTLASPTVCCATAGSAVASTMPATRHVLRNLMLNLFHPASGSAAGRDRPARLAGTATIAEARACLHGDDEEVRCGAGEDRARVPARRNARSPETPSGA